MTSDNYRLLKYSFFWSLTILVSVPFACLYCNNFNTLFEDFFRILTTPSKLVTDYFEIGSLGATLLNAALCGLACNLIIVLSRAKMTSLILAGYFLVIAHCFYGLNFLNMWPPFWGIAFYCMVTKKNFSKHLHLAMFATSLGPFISDFLFRYRLEFFVPGLPEIRISGVIISVIFSLGAGFIIPAIIDGTTKMHKGFNLYKAGLAIGLFGIFAFAFFYKTLGVEVPETVRMVNETYKAHNYSYRLFINILYCFIFITTLLLGYYLNGKTCKNYSLIWKRDGWKDDFMEIAGFPLTLVNIGLYGLCIIVFFNLEMLLTEGVFFTGPTTGIVIAAITFSACGQTPRNVWPVAVGFIVLSTITNLICFACNFNQTWTLTTQAYINGLAFATGLCPFSGRYGIKYGIIAGMLDAVICPITANMHGGFVLYNGGFSAGLTAMLLISILEFYNVKPLKNSDK